MKNPLSSESHVSSPTPSLPLAWDPEGLIRSLPLGLCLLNDKWEIVWINRVCNELFSPDRDSTVVNLTGKSWEKCFPSGEDFKAYLADAKSKLDATGTDRRLVQLVKSDGSLFWCEIALTPPSPRSGAKGILATLTDQSERRKTEQQLRDNEKRYRSLVQNSKDMLLVYGSDGRVSNVNTATEETLGYAPGEMIGKSGYSFVHHDDLVESQKFFKRLIENPGAKISTEFRVVRKDGTWLDVEGVAVNLLDDPEIRSIVANARDITDRKKTESALRHSEAMFGSLVESLTQNVFRKDLEGRFTFVNENFCRLVGRPKGDILGKTDFDIFPFEMAQKFRNDDLAVIAAGQVFEAVEENRSPDGRRIFVRVVKTPVRNSEGTIIELQGMFWDVTEETLAVERLKESEERWRTFVETLPVGVYRTTPSRDSSFIAANRAMAQMFGCATTEELLRHKPGDLHFDQEHREEYFRRIARDQRVVDMEMRLQKVDGTPIWVRNTTAANRDETGKIAYYDGVIEDITEQKKAEADLSASRQKYLNLIDNVTDGLYEVDLAGNMTFANRALLELLGREHEELMGQNNRAYMDEENARKVFEVFNEVFRTGEAHRGYVYELIAKDGEKKFVEGSISLMRDSVGAPTGFFGVIRDITVRRKAELALEEKTRQIERANHDLVRKNAELDEFTYIASHDLQEPLRKLTAFTDFLKKDIGEGLSPRVEKDLNFIVDAANRMQTLVQDLLQLSRVGKAAMKRERVPLNECVRAALDALAIRIESAGAEIVQDELPEVWGDRTLLTQLFQNLIGNALKFIPEGVKPKIHVTYELTNDQAVLGVKDNGIGIKPEYAEQIFSPFKRLHGRDKYEGSGIGLSICRKAVERHGGTIWVESELGRGAYFKFTLGERVRSRVA